MTSPRGTVTRRSRCRAREHPGAAQRHRHTTASLAPAGWGTIRLPWPSAHGLQCSMFAPRPQSAEGPGAPFPSPWRTSWRTRKPLPTARLPPRFTRDPEVQKATVLAGRRPPLAVANAATKRRKSRCPREVRKATDSLAFPYDTSLEQHIYRPGGSSYRGWFPVPTTQRGSLAL